MVPGDWNIAILGAWNRAILTPAWIQECVFALPEGSPVDVMVPLDGFATFQVHDKGVTIVPGIGQLLIQMAEPTPELLTRAMECARRAIDDLPRTPLRACGINLRFSAAEPSVPLLDNLRCKAEQIFSDNNYELRHRRRSESLAFQDGTLNVLAEVPTTGPCSVTLNFDRQSTDRAHILAWLNQSAADCISTANRIITLISE